MSDDRDFTIHGDHCLRVGDGPLSFSGSDGPYLHRPRTRRQKVWAWIRRRVLRRPRAARFYIVSVAPGSFRVRER